MSFREELEDLINRYSMEAPSDTPDFILAEYLVACLDAFGQACRQRTNWYTLDAATRALEAHRAGIHEAPSGMDDD